MKKDAERERQGRVDPGNMLFLAYIAAVVCLLLFGNIVQATTSEAESPVGPVKAETAAAVLEEEDSGGDLRPEEVQRGELLVVSDDGKYLPSPLLSQKVEMVISGITSRVKVEQHFANRSGSWVEALYVFPLPDECAIDHLRLKVGEKFIEGRIQEKEQAKATYARAKSEGKKTSLLLQNRPNIFTTKVANIGPNENVTVEIEYQQMVRYDSGAFSVRFPMVVGPRYIPGVPLKQKGENSDATISPVTVNNHGWAVNTDQVPDAAEITPVVDLLGNTKIPVQLFVDLAAGIPLSRIDSLYHGMTNEQVGEGHYKLEFTGEVLADRDFVLEWQPRENGGVGAALFAEMKNTNQYMLLMLMPPQQKLEKTLPRELIFILDISGSMAGTSIKQAKAAISLALSRLQPVDKFNIIVFNNTAHSLYPAARTADSANVLQAGQFVAGLKASGGTEMRSALTLALDGSNTHERLRQVVFLTDGAVGNEDALLNVITGRLGDSRLFTVGIGSAPNSYFMTRAATVGRGTYVYIGKGIEVQTKMMELFAKIESPVLSDLRVTVNGSDVEMEVYPSPIPDLYKGEPLLVALRSGWEMNTLQISGRLAGKLWQAEVDTSTYGKRQGIGSLWARKKIRSLMVAKALGADKEKVKNAVVSTALEHHLVSRYTSLVAVDDTVSRPKDKKVNTSAVKTHMPRGWQPGAVFGGGARTGTSSSLLLLVGSLLTMLAGSMMMRKSWWRI